MNLYQMAWGRLQELKRMKQMRCATLRCVWPRAVRSHGSKSMYMWSAASAVTDSVFQMHQSLASHQWVVSLIILWLEYRQCAHVDAKTLC